jgi:hypothetical protein
VSFSIADMLIANDWIVRNGVKAKRKTDRAIRRLDMIATWFFGLVTPDRVTAVSEAGRYIEWGRRLSPYHQQ